MKQNNHMRFEQHVKAPSELKKKTFKKIEQLNVVLELLGFYSSIPHSFLDNKTEEDKRPNKY